MDEARKNMFAVPVAMAPSVLAEVQYARSPVVPPESEPVGVVVAITLPFGSTARKEPPAILRVEMFRYEVVVVPTTTEYAGITVPMPTFFVPRMLKILAEEVEINEINGEVCGVFEAIYDMAVVVRKKSFGSTVRTFRITEMLCVLMTVTLSQIRNRRIYQCRSSPCGKVVI